MELRANIPYTFSRNKSFFYSQYNRCFCQLKGYTCEKFFRVNSFWWIGEEQLWTVWQLRTCQLNWDNLSSVEITSHGRSCFCRVCYRIILLLSFISVKHSRLCRTCLCLLRLFPLACCRSQLRRHYLPVLTSTYNKTLAHMWVTCNLNSRVFLMLSCFL